MRIPCRAVHHHHYCFEFVFLRLLLGHFVPLLMVKLFLGFDVVRPHHLVYLFVILQNLQSSRVSISIEKCFVGILIIHEFVNRRFLYVLRHIMKDGFMVLIPQS
jgi:hypothetical protein